MFAKKHIGTRNEIFVLSIVFFFKCAQEGEEEGKNEKTQRPAQLDEINQEKKKIKEYE